MKKKVLTLTLILTLVTCLFVFAACNPSDDTDGNINTVGADAFIKWMSLESTQVLIANYGTKNYGESLFSILDGAKEYDGSIPHATDATKVVKISTTTSVNDSGLLGYLEPIFEDAYGYDIQIASAGTGAAINAAKLGNADLILVHSKSQEDAFVADANKYARKVEGFDAERIAFMYNYFVLVGPTADPAGTMAADTAKNAFAAIATHATTEFISRGDSSGTHTKEISLWNTDLGITTAGAPATLAWYVHAGSGMGACLTMANTKNAYVLSDKATYLSYKNNKDGDAVPNLKIVYEADSSLMNTYAMIAVNPDATFLTA